MRVRGWAAVSVLAVAAVTGCSGHTTGAGASGTSSVAATGPAGSSASASPTPSVSIAVAPVDGAKSVRPDTPVVVTVTGGTVSAAKLVSSDGEKLQGRVDGSGGWQASDALKPGTSYTLTVTAKASDGGSATRTTTFRTLVPKATNRTTLIPGDDWTVGVGMPVVVSFASPVVNKQAAVKALTVTSTPAVQGAWHWMSSTEVQYRPASYWPSGAKVKVRAATGGVELSPGVWGRRTVTSSFSIGHAQISTVDVNKDTLTVRRAGKVIRTIPVTTGMTNSKPTFVTRGGIKVIMSREQTVRMDAASTGTDPKDPNYYNLLVHWALRLTYSGEFLHAAPWSVGSQGRANVSHGCTGMSDANAKWMYDNSQVGDVVVFVGSKRPLEPGNGYTAWNVPFSQWAANA